MSALAVDQSIEVDTHLWRGIAALRRNDFVAAIADFDRVLTIDPHDRFARWNRATARLSLGDYINGFCDHEVGWRLFDWRGFGPVRNDIDRLRQLPTWDGTPGARLLLYHELGYGDGIQCFRYLPTLAERCRIMLVLDPVLVGLARQFPGVALATKVPSDLSRFDARLPLFDVMRVLGATRENIPRQPYIAAHWRVHRGKIGIAWSGRTQRTFDAMNFVHAFSGAGILYSLQPGVVPRTVAPLEARDFAETARVIETLNHVVTIDTAVAHLAGAMGHPSVHVLVPFMSDWRWWHVGAWYPTVKVYRQSQGGDWPFADIARAIGG